MAAGGEVIGVIPRAVFAREVPHTGVQHLIEVDSMHERKARMAELADAFVALPGGVGTLEELFEVFTWQLLGLHDKPVTLLDPDGFYDPLVDQLDRIVDAGLPQRRQARGPRAGAQRRRAAGVVRRAVPDASESRRSPCRRCSWSGAERQHQRVGGAGRNVVPHHLLNGGTAAVAMR